MRPSERTVEAHLTMQKNAVISSLRRIHDVAFHFGDPGDVPVTGDWNGDGTDTAGLFRNGGWYLRNSTTTGVGDVSFGFGDRGDLPSSWS